MRIGIIGGSGTNPVGNIKGASQVEQQTAFGPVAPKPDPCRGNLKSAM